MTREELTRQILAIKVRAMQDVDKATESDWVGILSDALDDIETLCNTQKKEG